MILVSEVQIHKTFIVEDIAVTNDCLVSLGAMKFILELLCQFQKR